MTDTSVCAVLVTYRPDPDSVRAAVAAVRPQVAATVVVDNGPADVVEILGGQDAVVLRQVTNVGLASGQNVGIDWARRQGHTHVLILDQDSLPAPYMVEALVAGWRDLAAGRQVGAVGPRFLDPRAPREAPFVRVAFPMSRKIWCDAGTSYVQCDFLISSGSLIPLAVLEEVGGMDDGLFIDNVDIEWSFRARSHGFALFGVCAAAMEHRLGDDRQRVLGGLVQVVRHEPRRLYFIMRNRVVLYRRALTPRVWIVQDVPRLVGKLVLFGLVVGPRGPNLRHMLRGLADGARGRSGGCPLEAPP